MKSVEKSWEIKNVSTVGTLNVIAYYFVCIVMLSLFVLIRLMKQRNEYLHGGDGLSSA